MPACGLADSIDMVPALMELRVHNRHRRYTKRQTHTTAHGRCPTEEPPDDIIAGRAEDTLASMAGETPRGRPTEAETWEGRSWLWELTGEGASGANVPGQQSVGLDAAKLELSLILDAVEVSLPS